MNLTIFAIALGSAGATAAFIGLLAATRVLSSRANARIVIYFGFALISAAPVIGAFGPPLHESCASQTKDAAYDMWEKSKKMACDYWPWCETPRK